MEDKFSKGAIGALIFVTGVFALAAVTAIRYLNLFWILVGLFAACLLLFLFSGRFYDLYRRYPREWLYRKFLHRAVPETTIPDVFWFFGPAVLIFAVLSCLLFSSFSEQAWIISGQRLIGGSKNFGMASPFTTIQVISLSRRIRTRQKTGERDILLSADVRLKLKDGILSRPGELAFVDERIKESMRARTNSFIAIADLIPGTTAVVLKGKVLDSGSEFIEIEKANLGISW